MIIEEPPPVEGSSAAGVPRTLEGAPNVAANGAGLVAGGADVGGGVRSCGVVPLVVSGRGADGLCGQAGRLGVFLRERPEVGLSDVGLSLVEGRAVFEDRGVVLGVDREGLVAGLGVLAAGGVGQGVVRGVAGGGRPVFVFPGQGAQWEGMAVELLDSSVVFRDSLGVCGRALEELVDWRVEDVLRGVEGAPGLDRVDGGAAGVVRGDGGVGRVVAIVWRRAGGGGWAFAG